MSPIDKKKRFDSLMPSRSETPPHKAEVLDSLMGTSIEETNTAEVHRVGTPQMNSIQVDNIDKPNTHTEYIDDAETLQTIMKNTNDIGISFTDEVEVREPEQSFNIASVIKEYEQKKKAKKSYDELYTKHTFVVRKDLITRLERMANKHSRGFKTKFLNELLEAGLNQLEGKRR